MWTFLTSHAQVLLCVYRNNRMTAKQIADVVAITERNVQRILKDLEESGYITRQRVGRRNVYDVYPNTPMRHPAQHGHSIREMLETLGGPQPSARRRREAG